MVVWQLISAEELRSQIQKAHRSLAEAGGFQKGSKRFKSWEGCRVKLTRTFSSGFLTWRWNKRKLSRWWRDVGKWLMRREGPNGYHLWRNRLWRYVVSLTMPSISQAEARYAQMEREVTNPNHELSRHSTAWSLGFCPNGRIKNGTFLPEARTMSSEPVATGVTAFGV